MTKNMPHEEMYDKCKQHMHSYVLLETKDGLQTDGIITGLDEENVYVAVPLTGQMDSAQMDPNMMTEQVVRGPYQGNRPPYQGNRPPYQGNRPPQHGGYGSSPGHYGRPGYYRPGYRPGYGAGYGPRYGYGGYGPQQRFRRLVLPLAFLASVSLLPWY